MSSKTVTSPKIAVNKGRASSRENFVQQLEHLPYMNCCFIVWQHMADLNPFFLEYPIRPKFIPPFFFKRTFHIGLTENFFRNVLDSNPGPTVRNNQFFGVKHEIVWLERTVNIAEQKVFKITDEYSSSTLEMLGSCYSSPTTYFLPLFHILERNYGRC